MHGLPPSRKLPNGTSDVFGVRRTHLLADFEHLTQDFQAFAAVAARAQGKSQNPAYFEYGLCRANCVGDTPGFAFVSEIRDSMAA